MLKGIDISAHQGTVNFTAVKPAVDFVIIKATEGTTYKNPSLLTYANGVLNQGLPAFYYHFARPDAGNSPEAEANFFIKTLKDNNLLRLGTILFLDYEPPVWNGDVVLWCKKFLETVSAQFKGYKPLIYLNLSQTRNYNWSPVVQGNYGLWLAYYNVGLPSVPWSLVAFQQTTSSGSVPGIIGNVDLNVFFGDKTALGKYGLSAEAIATIDPLAICQAELATAKKQITALQQQIINYDKLRENILTLLRDFKA